jgi:uncharacterized membrane protein (DUF485 family)
MKQKIKYTILYGLVLLVLAYNLYVVMQLDKDVKEGFLESYGLSDTAWGFISAGIVIVVCAIIATVYYTFFAENTNPYVPKLTQANYNAAAARYGVRATSNGASSASNE